MKGKNTMQENGITTQKLPETEVFPLDDAAIELLAELDAQDKVTHTSRLAVLNYFYGSISYRATGN